MSDSDPPVGVLAGNGRMPFFVVDGIHAAGRRVAMVGLRGIASPRLIDRADEFTWSGVTRMGRWIRFFKKNGVREVVFIGGVRKREMYSRFRVLRYFPDLRTVLLWYFTLRKDKRDNAVLLATAAEFAGEGIELVSSVKYCPEQLAEEGVMTRTAIPRGALQDVEFGWRIARASAELDIGQSLAVKEGDIIAVEAIEGTDAMIARAGQLCRVGGWTLIKVARPDQDMRFDVPTIGPHTLKNLKEAGCRCLVVEAERTIITDKPTTLALADKLGIAVVGRKHTPA